MSDTVNAGRLVEWKCDHCLHTFYNDTHPFYFTIEDKSDKKFCRMCYSILTKTPVNLTIGHAPIDKHEGKKYLRKIKSPKTKEVIEVDVYAVLAAFGVESHPIGHAIKKLLCAGQRGKGDKKADLIGAIAAINRAIDDLEDG